MIRILHYSQDGKLRADLKISDLSTALKDQRGVLWVDLVEEPVEHCEALFKDLFNFHPLAVEDALHDIQSPKIDDWRSYLYLALHGLQSDHAENPFVATLELDIFLGRNYIVTYQKQAIPVLDRLWKNCLSDSRVHRRGASFLLYRITDQLASTYHPVLDRIEDTINEIEDEIFERPTPATLEKIFQLKRAMLRLRRVLAPQREVINKLGQDVYPVINRDYRVFFHDVHDYLTRMNDLSESRRELVNSAMNIYLSAVNNRMNDVMRTLAVFTALFLPISFLTGFFGMNFFQPTLDLNPWTGGFAFFLVLFASMGLPLGLFLWMKRRGWF
jgi:magnesium transporter